MAAAVCGALCLCALAAEYQPPAGERAAVRRPGAESVLPGGRLISPLGAQFPTGPGPMGLAVSPHGETAVTLDGGAIRNSLTVLQREGSGWRTSTLKIESGNEGGGGEGPDSWRSAFSGVVFASGRDVYASDGLPGRVRLLDTRSGTVKQTYELNAGGFDGSHSGELAFDARRGLLYVLDRGNSRLVVIDTKRKRAAAGVPVEHPVALALSPDARRVYVTHRGEAGHGAVTAVDVENPAAPGIAGTARTGKVQDGPGRGGAGVVATHDYIFVSNENQDSVSVIQARTLRPVREIELRVPGLEGLRGMLPAGLHHEPANGWILAVEAGINAVAVIDVRTFAVMGHIPAAWFPTQAASREGRLFIVSAKGHGSGPNASRQGPVMGNTTDNSWRGAVSILPLPGADELPAMTRRVWTNNGFTPASAEAAPLPSELDHVVIIEKQGRTFDEVFGDVETAANGPVAALPPLARFGRRGVIVQQKNELRQRLGLRFVNVTPNHHAMAERFAFSDNFYAGAGLAADELPWKEAALWRHLERHGLPFRSFGGRQDGPNRNGTDHHRANQFIRDIDRDYLRPGKPLPRLIVLRLPGGRMAKPSPEDGYPFQASYVAGNDHALGRVVRFLSQTPYWKRMAILIMDEDTRGGADHIDSHRTVFLAVSPWAKQNYCSHVNASFPAVLKLAFRILRLPPMDLASAAAADLGRLFAEEADVRPYSLEPSTLEVFDPAKAREPGP
ncbi:MAG: bifunctional YncE family protein/alkaline phosphatase family protein [Bryobacterales bacterium]|nr:bifunctional YncE family protein/alkaline phosphatase family protein [Bryobacterales bacterium]